MRAHAVTTAVIFFIFTTYSGLLFNITYFNLPTFVMLM